MSKNYFSIPLNRCIKTPDKSINEIQNFLCCICGNIPLPPLRDKTNIKNVFCQGCYNSNPKIETIKPSYQELTYLKELVIDCKNECDEIFTYDLIEKLSSHEEFCYFKKTAYHDYETSDNKNNFCKKCDIKCENSNHDCITFMNLKIKKLSENLDELKLENIYYKNGIETLNNESQRTKNILNEFEKKFQNSINSLNLKFTNLETQLSKLSSSYNTDIKELKSKYDENSIVNIKYRMDKTEKIISQLNQMQVEYENSQLKKMNASAELVKKLEIKFTSFTQYQEKFVSENKELKHLIPSVLYTLEEISKINEKIIALEERTKDVLANNENNKMNKSTFNNFSDFSINLLQELVSKKNQTPTNEINKLKELMKFNKSALLSNLRKKSKFFFNS